MLFTSEIAPLPPQLQALQNARLKEQFAYLNAWVPLCQRRFAEAAVNVEVAGRQRRELGFATAALTTEHAQQHESLRLRQGSLVRKSKDTTGLNMCVNLLGCGQLARSGGGRLNRVRDLRELR